MIGIKCIIMIRIRAVLVPECVWDIVKLCLAVFEGAGRRERMVEGGREGAGEREDGGGAGEGEGREERI